LVAGAAIFDERNQVEAVAVVFGREHRASGLMNPVELITASAIVLGCVVSTVTALAMQVRESDQFIDVVVIEEGHLRVFLRSG
jgi:hypothetical protein